MRSFTNRESEKARNITITLHYYQLVELEYAICHYYFSCNDLKNYFSQTGKQLHEIYSEAKKTGTYDSM